MSQKEGAACFQPFYQSHLLVNLATAKFV